jgi:hypothetical protein
LPAEIAQKALKILLKVVANATLMITKIDSSMTGRHKTLFAIKNSKYVSYLSRKSNLNLEQF